MAVTSRASILVLVLLSLSALASCRTRKYFIAADEVEWDYAPTGLNFFKDVPLLDDPDSATFFESGPDRIGGTYIKAQYRRYTDASFDELLQRDDDDFAHIGFLGPPIYCEVGDTVEVHFRNNARHPFSMHPFGLATTKANEGARTPGEEETPGDSVAPGDEFIYTWHAPGSSGPAPGDWSSVLYMYVSHVDYVADTNAGLAGPIVVTAKGMADDEGRPTDVDREFFIYYAVSDENASTFLEDNVVQYLGEEALTDELLEDGDFQESNLMHGMNGYLYNNLPDLTMVAYERVRWYVFALGTEVDLHTAHWHGQTLLDRGLHRVDVTIVFPATTSVLDMIPDSPGIWFSHCHVNDHVKAGMMALFEVLPVSSPYTSVRNLATTYDLFSFLDAPAQVQDNTDSTSTGVSNPFSTSSASFITVSLAAVVAVFAVLA